MEGVSIPLYRPFSCCSQWLLPAAVHRIYRNAPIQHPDWRWRSYLRRINPAIATSPASGANLNWVLHQQSFLDALRNSFLHLHPARFRKSLWRAVPGMILNANLKAKPFWRMGVLLPYIVALSCDGIIFADLLRQDGAIATDRYRLNLIMAWQHLSGRMWPSPPS